MLGYLLFVVGCTSRRDSSYVIGIIGTFDAFIRWLLYSSSANPWLVDLDLLDFISTVRLFFNIHSFYCFVIIYIVTVMQWNRLLSIRFQDLLSLVRRIKMFKFLWQMVRLLRIFLMIIIILSY